MKIVGMAFFLKLIIVKIARDIPQAVFCVIMT